MPSPRSNRCPGSRATTSARRWRRRSPKSQEDRRLFELLFERWFFRAAEAEAIEREIGETEQRHEGAERLDIDELREQIRQAIVDGDEGQMRIWPAAIAAFGQQARARAWSASTCSGSAARWSSPPHPAAAGRRRRRAAADRPRPAQPLRAPPAPRARTRPDRAHRDPSLLAAAGRARPGAATNPTQDLAAVHRAVSQMKRRLATLGHEQRGRRKAQTVDVRRTMRASLGDRRRADAPALPAEAAAATGDLRPLRRLDQRHLGQRLLPLVLHALHDSFRKLRSFVFIERISEVDRSSSTERDFREIARRISSEGGVADVSGYTDYGRVWLEFLTEISDDLDPRSTVIVLGDARTNGREPHAEVFAQVSERAGRLFWLNPEPKLYWNYGDSVMAATSATVTAPSSAGRPGIWRTSSTGGR